MKKLFNAACMILAPLLACLVAGTASAQEEAGGGLVQMVVDLLQEQDKEMRSLALDQVRSECPGEAATKRFAAELPGLPPEAQAGLLSALGDRGDPVARPAVLELLDTAGQTPVKLAAIAALGQLGEPGDVERLSRILAEGSEAERESAASSLVRLQGDGVPEAIAARMDGAPPPLRIALIEVLTERRAPQTIPAILAAAVSDEPAVRVAAMQALSEIGDPEHLPGMVQGVLKAEPGRERDAAEKCVMQVCRRIEDPERRAAPLLEIMERLDEADRRALLPALGRVGGAEALQAVEAAIGSEDRELHGLGIRAVCNWPDAGIAPRLIELVQNDPHPPHRIAVLRALIRVAPLDDGRSDQQRLQLLQKAMEMCTRDEERKLVLDRARTIKSLETLQFILPYVDQPAYAEQACLSIVELAHHRGLREPNKAEFDEALDKVLAVSKDPVVRDRAQRYKLDQTWVRPEEPETPIVVAETRAGERPERAAEAAASLTGKPLVDLTQSEAGEPGRPRWVLAIVACLGIIVLALIAAVAARRRAR